MSLNNLLRAALITLVAATMPATADDSYQPHCAHCHGATGEGNDTLGAPNLTRLSESYIKRQLQGFKEGWRGKDNHYSQSMTAAIASLDTPTLSSTTTAISRLPDSKVISQAPRNGDVTRGKNLYTAYCGACHGTGANGNDALGAPNLLGLSSDYLMRQYRAFAKGKRGTHPNDKYGQQMARLSKALKDPQLIDDVTAYVVSIAE
jgi:cytochrome c553